MKKECKKIKRRFDKNFSKVKKYIDHDKKIVKNLTKKEFKKILESRIHYFFLGGLIIFLFEWLFTIFLTEIFGIIVTISFFISLVIGLYFLYLFHKKITFKIKAPSTSKNYQRFIITYIFSYSASWTITSILSMRFNYILVIPIVMLILGIISYILNRYWVFATE